MTTPAAEFAKHDFRRQAASGLRSTIAALCDPAPALLAEVAAAEALVASFQPHLPLVDVTPFASVTESVVSRTQVDAGVAEETAVSRCLRPPRKQPASKTPRQSAKRRADSSQPADTSYGTETFFNPLPVAARPAAKKSQGEPSPAAAHVVGSTDAGATNASTASGPLVKDGMASAKPASSLLEELVHEVAIRIAGESQHVTAPPSEPQTSALSENQRRAQTSAASPAGHAASRPLVDVSHGVADKPARAIDATHGTDLSSMSLISDVVDALLVQPSTVAVQELATGASENSLRAAPPRNREKRSPRDVDGAPLSAPLDMPHSVASWNQRPATYSQPAEPSPPLSGPDSTAGSDAPLDAAALARSINDELSEQARRHGIDLS